MLDKIIKNGDLGVLITATAIAATATARPTGATCHCRRITAVVYI